MANDISSICQQYQDQIAGLIQWRTELRKKEKNLKVRESTLTSQYQAMGGSQLAQSLSQILPPELMPGNVGTLDKVAWGFFYEFDFDFGATPTLTSTTSQTKQIQISQEAAFLMLDVSVNFEDPTNQAGFLGPWQLTIRDNQSTRQFNDAPIPLQVLGGNSRPTEFPTPYLFQPNASVSAIVNTWLSSGESIVTTGTNSKFSIACWGLRVRIDDMDKVLGTFFQNS